MDSLRFEEHMEMLRNMPLEKKQMEDKRREAALEKAYRTYCGLSSALKEEAEQAVLLQQEAEKAGVLPNMPKDAWFVIQDSDSSPAGAAPTKHIVFPYGEIWYNRIACGVTCKDGTESFWGDYGDAQEFARAAGADTAAGLEDLYTCLDHLRSAWTSAKQKFTGTLDRTIVSMRVAYGVPEAKAKEMKLEGPDGNQ
jgi:hypothetical protein